ncbi:hypothetical protein PVAND_015406 [Polypedilum vanderplanki]|uniref:Peptidase S1 domain-containing protein n=1 Tax=Polypedilum vanderplanki TaxID=319348 RepID=A0A9J6BCJ2_POLVA|nr:hypothetical protein PVAND_015406 [Polypedilum vanderplanki]
MHPDWNIRTSSFDADVSILTLKNEISFNNFIQPACLPEITSNVYNTKGTVAGYGLSLESGNNHENRPKFLEINSVTQEECLFSNEIYNKISSRRSFCAGEKGKSACRGDSGGGFYVKSTNKYTIFGIVSAAPFVDCVENVYVIFTNVPKFIVWIKNIMDKKIDDDEVTVQGRTASLECEIKHKSDDNTYECFNNKLKSTQQNTQISSITGSLNDQNVSKLRTVNIVSAEVTYIPDFTAVNRKFPKFDQLYIVLSGLKFVERKQLAKMPLLTLLNFFGNEIEFLPEDAFDDLKNLKILAFVQNKIKVLPPKLLWNLPKLVELWAYENPYEIIPRRFFKNNKEVVKLWMGYNKIKKIEVNFKALPKLDVLDLRENDCINLQTCISCGAENFNDIQEKIDRDCNQDAIQWVSLQEA